MPHLFLVQIEPIQPFIASSRVIPEHFYTQAKNQLYAVFNVDLKERLSSVDLLKHLGRFLSNKCNQAKTNVFSTSHIAAYRYMSYLAKLPASHQLATAKKHWQTYINEIKNANISKAEHKSDLEELSSVAPYNILERYDGAMLFPRDLEHRRPKPTCRIVPAGSVFFLSLEGKLKHIEAWVKRTWIQLY